MNTDVVSCTTGLLMAALYESPAPPVGTGSVRENQGFVDGFAVAVCYNLYGVALFVGLSGVRRLGCCCELCVEVALIVVMAADGNENISILHAC